MLFGRRKPGFSKEVELKPEEIPGEFSDRLDPANFDDANPKFEKAGMIARADAVINGEEAPQPEQRDEKIDLFDYMDSLPEVDDPFQPSEDPMVEIVDETPMTTEEVRDSELLAGYIRERTKAALLTHRKSLEQDVDDFETVLAEMEQREDCQDIKTVQGSKDTYFYSEELMTANYAMIAAMIEDKDITGTIARMVRWNCKTYPSPTPRTYFTRHPYYYTDAQIDLAISQMQSRGFEDIRSFNVDYNGAQYFYAESEMERRYAKALAESAETPECDS